MYGAADTGVSDFGVIDGAQPRHMAQVGACRPRKCLPGGLRNMPLLGIFDDTPRSTRSPATVATATSASSIVDHT